MENSQNQDQTEVQELEPVEGIDERVLNTPAEDQKVTIPQIDEGQQINTFMQFNKTPQVQPGQGIVLDLAGEKAEIKEEDIQGETDTKLLRKMTGQELSGDEAANPGAFIIIIFVAILLFGFLVLNMKRSEEIGKLQQEIEKLKKFSISSK